MARPPSVPSAVGTTVIIIILLACGTNQVISRKCVCTSKACKESGAKVCRTRFSCYTELIYDGSLQGAKELPGNSIRTTRGCTEGATPLLCESKSWHTGSSDEDAGSNSLEHLGKAPWPRLTCCDNHDYCNAADEDFEPQSSSPRAVTSSSIVDRIIVETRDDGALENAPRDYRSATVTIDGSALGAHQTLQHLHIAALILAIAALISVFGACYVVTRFLSASGSLSHRMDHRYDDRLDF